ncbi:MAG: hypothetical protein WCL20_05940 [Actinomycetes bacterium]
MRIIVLQHEVHNPPGLLGDWARDRDHELAVTMVEDGVTFEVPAAGEALVCLGSDHRSSKLSTHDEITGPEVDCIRATHDSGGAFLGICFGAHALALALGGSVTRLPALEVELGPIHVEDSDLIAAGPWLRWNRNTAVLPESLRAAADVGGIPMTFISRGAIGLQFHPEAGTSLAEKWISHHLEWLARWEIDVPQLRAQVRAAAIGATERAFAQFDMIEARWRSEGRV